MDILNLKYLNGIFVCLKCKFKIAFGFEGNAENMNISMLSDMPEGFESRVIKGNKPDSLYYFFNPDIKTDSLVFKVTNTTYVDTFTVRTRSQKKDSLIVSAKSTSNLKLNEDESMKLDDDDLEDKMLKKKIYLKSLIYSTENKFSDL